VAPLEISPQFGSDMTRSSSREVAAHCYGR
jgi:hypothetical protein